MSDQVPRLRMFAVPNGSGKSTLKSVLPRAMLGIYLNPDEMELEMRKSGALHLSNYGVAITEMEAKEFLRKFAFGSEKNSSDFTQSVQVSAGQLRFDPVVVNSYVASAIVNLFREKLIITQNSFTFETVMSHPGKVEFLERAQKLGYRTYLYFIATESPSINISRVRARVRSGGHSVPEDKIVKRYEASLNLLVSAIRKSNRAYIFDNSSEGQEKTLLAEVINGRELEIKTDKMPAWFKRAVWHRITGATK